MKISHENPGEQASAMDNYYKFQSKIYDMTRWSFLFGRDEVTKDSFLRLAKFIEQS